MTNIGSSSKNKPIQSKFQRAKSPTKGYLVSNMIQYSEVVRQRDELRIRIQHLLHILNDSQAAFEEQTKENQVLRHALSQGIVATNAASPSHDVLLTAPAPATADENVYF